MSGETQVEYRCNFCGAESHLDAEVVAENGPIRIVVSEAVPWCPRPMFQASCTEHGWVTSGWVDSEEAARAWAAGHLAIQRLHAPLEGLE